VARTEGKSLPTIAKEEEISVGQVQRDLETASTLSGGDKVEPAGGKVTGQDGRTRPATPAKPLPKAVETGSLFCSKCTRLGPVTGCSECATLAAERGRKEPKKRTSLNGQVLTTAKDFETHVGHARNILDKLARQYGLAPDGKAIRGDAGYKDIEKQMSELMKSVKEWCKGHGKKKV
jgi:hypothetical protein